MSYRIQVLKHRASQKILTLSTLEPLLFLWFCSDKDSEFSIFHEECSSVLTVIKSLEQAEVVRGSALSHSS